MQKMIAFYHDKEIGMLELGFTLPSRANICLHNSTDENFYPVGERDEDLEKFREIVVDDPCIVFTRNAIVDEVFFKNQQTYSILLLELMLAKYSPTWCINQCQPIFIDVGI